MTLALLLACDPDADTKDPIDTGDPDSADSGESDSESGGGADAGPWTTGPAVPVEEVRAATWTASRGAMAGSAVAVAGGSVLVGEPSRDSGVGAVYVVAGDATGEAGLAEVPDVIRAADEGGYFGYYLASAPDLDGDGLVEVGVGRTHALVNSTSEVGAAYKLSGVPSGESWLDRSDPSGFALVEGAEGEDRLARPPRRGPRRASRARSGCSAGRPGRPRPPASAH